MNASPPSKGTPPPCSCRPFWRRSELWLGLLLLLVLFVRVRLRDFPLERDEGEYAYAGQLLLHGVLPYDQVYNMKLPGTYALYALLMKVFGQTPAGIHLGVALVCCGSIGMVYWLGRRLLDPLAGLVAAWLWGLLSMDPAFLGLQGHASHFVAFFALGGACLLVQATQPAPGSAPLRSPTWRSSTALLFGAGLCFGLAVLMKQHGVFFALGASLYLIALRRGWLGVPATSELPLHAMGLFALGLALPYLLLCALMLASGLFSAFVFWTISYASAYATQDTWLHLRLVAPMLFVSLLKPLAALWLLGLLGLLELWREKRLGQRARLLLTLLLLGAGLSVCPGLHFRSHYFLQLLPLIALLGGIAASRSWHNRNPQRSALGRSSPLLAAILLALTAYCVIAPNAELWFRLSPLQAMVKTYHTSLFADTVLVSDYLKAHTASDTRIAVMGSEPEVYFLSQRRGATGFIYTYPLMENNALALRLQKQMIGEIERNRPDYVLFVDDLTSWCYYVQSTKHLFEWWKAYSAATMKPIMTVRVDVDKAFLTSDDSVSRRLILFQRRPEASRSSPDSTAPTPLH